MRAPKEWGWRGRVGYALFSLAQRVDPDLSIVCNMKVLSNHTAFDTSGELADGSLAALGKRLVAVRCAFLPHPPPAGAIRMPTPGPFFHPQRIFHGPTPWTEKPLRLDPDLPVRTPEPHHRAALDQLWAQMRDEAGPPDA